MESETWKVERETERLGWNQMLEGREGDREIEMESEAGR